MRTDLYEEGGKFAVKVFKDENEATEIFNSREEAEAWRKVAVTGKSPEVQSNPEPEPVPSLEVQSNPEPEPVPSPEPDPDPVTISDDQDAPVQEQSEEPDPDKAA